MTAPRTLHLGGRRLAYHDAGPSDAPTLLFAHGNSTSSADFAGIFAGPLRAHYRLLALDLPGHGGSVPPADPDDGYSVPGFARTVAAFAEALGATAVVGVGVSLGGHVLLEAAPSMPALAGLLVCGTPPVRPGPTLADGLSSTLDAFFTAEPPDAAVRAATATQCGDPATRAALYARFQRTDPAMRAALAASLAAGKLADEVAIAERLTVPLAVVLGEDDALVNRAYVERLRLPTLWRGRVQIVDGARHAVHLDRPEAFEDLVGAFARDVLG